VVCEAGTGDESAATLAATRGEQRRSRRYLLTGVYGGGTDHGRGGRHQGWRGGWTLGVDTMHKRSEMETRPCPACASCDMIVDLPITYSESRKETPLGLIRRQAAQHSTASVCWPPSVNIREVSQSSTVTALYHIDLSKRIHARSHRIPDHRSRRSVIGSTGARGGNRRQPGILECRMDVGYYGGPCSTATHPHVQNPVS